MKNFLKIFGIIALAAVSMFTMAACGDLTGDDGKDPGKEPAVKQTPQASDYTFGNLSQEEGGVVPVTITRRSDASPGAVVNIRYSGSTTVPQTAGTYAVLFDVEEATNWYSALNLPAGNLVVSQKQTPQASDYTFGNLSQTVAGGVVAVTITRKSDASPGEVSNIRYNGQTAVPQAEGVYPVLFDVAEATGWNAATNLSAGNLVVSASVYGPGPLYSKLYAQWYDTQSNADTGASGGLLFEFTELGKLKIAQAEYYYKEEEGIIKVSIGNGEETLSYTIFKTELTLAEAETGSASTLSAIIGSRYKATPLNLVVNGNFSDRNSDWPNWPVGFNITDEGAGFKWEGGGVNGDDNASNGIILGWSDFVNGPPYGFTVAQTITGLTPGYYTFTAYIAIKDNPTKKDSILLSVYTDGETSLGTFDAAPDIITKPTQWNDYFRAFPYDITDILVTGDTVTVQVKASGIYDVLGISSLGFYKY